MEKPEEMRFRQRKDENKPELYPWTFPPSHKTDSPVSPCADENQRADEARPGHWKKLYRDGMYPARLCDTEEDKQRYEEYLQSLLDGETAEPEHGRSIAKVKAFWDEFRSALLLDDEEELELKIPDQSEGFQRYVYQKPGRQTALGYRKNRYAQNPPLMSQQRPTGHETRRKRDTVDNIVGLYNKRYSIYQIPGTNKFLSGEKLKVQGPSKAERMLTELLEGLAEEIEKVAT